MSLCAVVWTLATTWADPPATNSSQRVQTDILCQLRLSSKNVFRASFDRPNLTIQVMYKDTIDQPVKDLCKFLKPLAARGACIVYGS